MHRIAAIFASLALAACVGHPVLNALTPSGGYRIATGVTYQPDRKLALDLYAPARDKVRGDPAPVVVFFHGGRWQHGQPSDYRFVGQALATRGFVVMIPELRQYPDAVFEDFMRDAAAAVRWAQQQAARHGGDPDRLFVMGHSSGAHVAAMLALDPQWLAAAGSDRGALRGMIGLAGPYDFLPITAPDLRDIFGPPERFELTQPVTFADRDAPPLLLLHGEDDETVDVENTRRLAAAQAAAGGAIETVYYADMNHGWILSTLAAPLRAGSDVLEHVVSFIRRQGAAPRPSEVIGISASPLKR